MHWLQAGKGKPTGDKLADENMETIHLVRQWEQLEIASWVLCRWKAKVTIKSDLCQFVVPHELQDDMHYAMVIQQLYILDTLQLLVMSCPDKATNLWTAMGKNTFLVSKEQNVIMKP